MRILPPYRRRDESIKTRLTAVAGEEKSVSPTEVRSGVKVWN